MAWLSPWFYEFAVAFYLRVLNILIFKYRTEEIYKYVNKK